MWYVARDWTWMKIHTALEEADIGVRLDYIHYNRVKHGGVRRPCDWPCSTFHRSVVLGQYASAWGACAPAHLSALDCE